MTKFESLKLKNIDELAEWFDKYIIHDYVPWIKWWDENYCSKCEPEIINKYSVCCGDMVDMECAWCELNNNKCKYFKDMDEMPSNKEIIKMWLESKDSLGENKND